MKQNQKQYHLAIAINLTAIGLKRGRTYTHKGARVYTIYLNGMEYIVDPSDGLPTTFNSPYRAARYFAELTT